MKIQLTSIFVDDQAKALRFYTEVLGFHLKHDVPVGEHRWLTVTSPEDPDGPELLLEPNTHPAVAPFQEALRADGIPAHAFEVEDVEAEWRRLTDLGVRFTLEPTDAGTVVIAVLEDGCGNLAQLMEVKGR